MELYFELSRHFLSQIIRQIPSDSIPSFSMSLGIIMYILLREQ